MLQIFRLILITVFAMTFAGPVTANGLPQVNWDRSEAARAAAQTDTVATRETLRQLSMSGESAELLALLKSTAARQDWPAPARESVLHDFVSGLRSLPPRSVAPEVMDYLASYQASVLIAQEDHPQTAVPLFNIKATTGGVRNSWLRQEAAYAGGRMLQHDPMQLIEAFRAAPGNAPRQGYLDALDGATAGQLEAVTFLALAGLERDPALTQLAGRSALLSRDARALEQLLRTGQGPAMAQVLRASKDLLSTEQTGRLLQIAVLEGSAETAALAIAELSPGLLGSGRTERMLLDLLDHPELGSTAALALAKNPSTGTLRELDRMAASGDASLASARARLALEINRSQFAAEVQE